MQHGREQIDRITAHIETDLGKIGLVLHEIDSRRRGMPRYAELSVTLMNYKLRHGADKLLRKLDKLGAVDVVGFARPRAV